MSFDQFVRAAIAFVIIMIMVFVVQMNKARGQTTLVDKVESTGLLDVFTGYCPQYPLNEQFQENVNNVRAVALKSPQLLPYYISSVKLWRGHYAKAEKLDPEKGIDMMCFSQYVTLNALMKKDTEL